MKAAPEAAAKSRSRKIDTSSIGARWRSSIARNTGSSTAATPKLPITSASFQPLRPPREMA
jgi:hypothetical protein